MAMIITISGAIGSGKSTINKILAKKLGMKSYSTGGHMRQMAKDRGLTLLELTALAEKNDDIDKELDRWQVELGKKEDDFIIDARIGFHFIPHSKKVFLYVSPEEGARRIFEEKRAYETNFGSLEKTLEKNLARIKSEKERWLQYYGIDFYDKKHYDIWIDTTEKAPKQIVEEIIEALDIG